jgi:magnesium-protoporphyrin IX monomethyl ester (oxidative) cyclase
LDIDHPRWEPTLNRMQDANVQIAAGRKQGGVGGWVKRMIGSAKAGMAFVSLLTIPVKKNAVPDSPRLEPAY